MRHKNCNAIIIAVAMIISATLIDISVSVNVSDKPIISNGENVSNCDVLKGGE